MQFKEPERFWSKVDVSEPDKCWEWKANVVTGRGRFSIHGRTWLAHRVAWVLTYGNIPGGLYVCHHCDNPTCCNPYHLFLGTQTDNLQDSARKGRRTKKLSKSDVRRARKLLEEGDLWLWEIADLLGVARSTVGRIKRRKIWSWLDKED